MEIKKSQEKVDEKLNKTDDPKKKITHDRSILTVDTFNRNREATLSANTNANMKKLPNQKPSKKNRKLNQENLVLSFEELHAKLTNRPNICRNNKKAKN